MLRVILHSLWLLQNKMTALGNVKMEHDMFRKVLVVSTAVGQSSVLSYKLTHLPLNRL